MVKEPTSALRSSCFSTGTSGSLNKSLSGDRTRKHCGPNSDPKTSTDEDCDDKPRKGYKFTWRRDANGDKNNVEEKVLNKSPSMVYKYVRDASTGKSYKRVVLREDPETELVYQWVIDPGSGQ